jgi:hypothetical protein
MGILHLSNDEKRFTWKSIPITLPLAESIAGLKRTLLLPVEFNK